MKFFVPSHLWTICWPNRRDASQGFLAARDNANAAQRLKGIRNLDFPELAVPDFLAESKRHNDFAVAQTPCGHCARPHIILPVNRIAYTGCVPGAHPILLLGVVGVGA